MMKSLTPGLRKLGKARTDEAVLKLSDTVDRCINARLNGNQQKLNLQAKGISR